MLPFDFIHAGALHGLANTRTSVPCAWPAASIARNSGTRSFRSGAMLNEASVRSPSRTYV